MIVEYLLDVIQEVLTWLFSLVPEGWAPSSAGWTARAAEVSAQAGWTGYWLPFDTAASAASGVITVWLGLQVYVFVCWLLERLHILG